MSVTILEALQNADFNLQNFSEIGFLFAREQLHNAVILLEKGYGIYEEIEPLLEQYGTFENVPEPSDQAKQG